MWRDATPDHLIAVLFDGLQCPDGACEIAERITRELTRAQRINNHDVTISASIGVSITAGKAKSVNDLIRDADQAMYLAKRNGRARWEWFERDAAPSERGGRVNSYLREPTTA